MKLINGDSLEILKTIEDNSIDSIVTDPPYELGFMNKSWDNTGIANNVEIWKECLRILKPGGHLLSFGGTRTYHRMACTIEDAGFEIRDMIEWIYGSGFPKSLNIGKAVDKLRGNEREVINSKSSDDIRGGNMMNQETKRITTFTTKGNSEWEGWGTSLKPAHEPICMARKPLSEKTVVENCIKWNTGGINIDGCRVVLNSEKQPTGSVHAVKSKIEQNWGFAGNGGNETNTLGRFPANLIHDGSDEVRECFPETGNVKGRHDQYSESDFVGDGGWKSAGVEQRTYDGSGNASRFFKSIIYTPKASKFERNKGCENLEKKIIGMSNGAQTHGKEYDKCQSIGLNVSKPMKNYHPTVKAVTLMRYLCKLVTPPNGTVLDPFMGSGTTGIACKLEGFDFIGIEKEEDYCKIAQARINNWEIEEEKLF